jgi:hypothetical protein
MKPNTNSKYLRSTAAAIGVAAAFLCSCATSSVQNTWKSLHLTKPVGKVAVLAIDERGIVRQGFENRFVTQLEKVGAEAVVTHKDLSLPAIKQDKKAAAEALMKNGADAVLIFRLAGSASSYREIQPGGERYASTITGIDSYGWYDYYTVGFMSMSPSYGSLKQTAFVEASLFDLKTEKRVWGCIMKAVIKETTDRMAEMDPLVEKVVGAMRKEGVVR